jgi:hypothetical protein
LQKLGFIFIIGLFLSGCSVHRSGKQIYTISNANSTGNIYENLRRQNISKQSFFIEKAEIEVIGKEGSEKFLASVKFEYPDKYLISVKNTTGIEGVRVFISKDTLLANDRLNKIHYYGSPYYLSKKLGISVFVLPVIFGDLVSEGFDGTKQSECIEKMLKIDAIIKGVKVNYLVDCTKGKIFETILESSSNTERIIIEYSKFKKIHDILLPEDISILDKKRMVTIKVRINKVQFPWNGIIDFIPGKNYETQQLL